MSNTQLITGTENADRLNGFTGFLNTINGLAGNDTLSGANLADLIDGGSDNDTLYGNAGDDTLRGQTGHDSLNGGDGDDTLTGGTGNDSLRGGEGTDTYIFTTGDGQDQIANYDTDGSRDVVRFSGLAQGAVTSVARAQGTNNLVIAYGTGDRLTLTNYFNNYNPAYRVEQFVFTDGTWDWAAIQARASTVNGTASNDDLRGFDGWSNTLVGLAGDDTLRGANSNDLIDGGSDRDTLYGGSGNDTLWGQTGNDGLYGEDGDDTLTGGTGNDRLTGGAGADTYVLAAGDGQDRIDNYDTDGSVDVVRFAGLARSAVTSLVRTQGADDLVIDYGTGDRLTLTKYFYNDHPAYRIDQFVFTDGTWDWNAIRTRASTITGTEDDNHLRGFDGWSNTLTGLGGDDTLRGANVDDLIDGGSDRDTLYGNAGNDTLSGQEGNDSMDGGAGDDTLTGGTGNDRMTGGAGADTYVFAAGDGRDVIDSYDTDGGVDTVRFSGLTLAVVTSVVRTQGKNDLVIAYGTGDRLTLSNYFNNYNSAYRVDQFIFTDGTWDWDAIRTQASIITGTTGDDTRNGFDGWPNTLIGLAGDDTLRGANGDDVIDGGPDRDYLHGNAGNDTLSGQEDHDRLVGGNGDDTLTGGTGNDRLTGGEGADTYVFAAGDGQDLIINRDTDGSLDTVTFTGLARASVTSVTRPQNTNDLVIEYGIGDRLTVENYYYRSDNMYRVDQFVFTDGTFTSLSGALNQPPTAGNRTVTTREDTARVFTAADFGFLDADSGDALSAVTITRPASAGRLTLGGTEVNFNQVVTAADLAAKRLSFMPAADANGASYASFGFRVSDGDALSLDDYTMTLSVTAVNDSPSGRVTIGGTAAEGQRLTASNNLIDPDGLGTLGYQWLRGRATIAGAIASDYTLVAADIGQSITVRAAYRDGGGTQEQVTSDAVIPIARNPNVIIAAQNDYQTREDGSAVTFAVRLGVAPVREVAIDFTSSDPSEGTLAVGTLTFTAANWNVAQTLRVTGVQDYDNDGTVAYRVTGTLNTQDVNYARVVVPALSLMNAGDVTNDTPGHPSGNYPNGIDRDVPQYLTPPAIGELNNVLIGLDGPDRLYGGYGMDDISGGLGDDRLYGEQDDDRLFGEGGNDQLWGGYDDDTLQGGAGDDRLYGEQGDDRLEGGLGNDTLDGGLGTDTLIGGAGNDTYYLGYDAADRIDDQGLATDLDTVIMPYVMTSYTLPSGIENGSIAAGTAASSLTGNSANNRLTGNDGANTLSGAAGTDTLIGGNGNDRCDGGTGNDTLSGGNGNDVLLGGVGTDTATGGAGADVFKFVLRSEGADTLSDFVSGTDKLQVVGPNFGLTPGATPRFVTAVSQVTGTTPVFIYTQSTGALVFDSNGTGAGGTTTLANLRAGTALRVGDIQVVAS